MSSDDRPEYASLQAVLFGPFLLAGLTTGDWDAKTGAAISDWITPVPSSYNSQLVTLTQESGGGTFVLSTVNTTSLTMQPRPVGGGTDAAVHATFRLIPQGSSPTTIKRRHATAEPSTTMIEPFDLPGMVITNSLTVSGDKSPASLFNVVPGLAGEPGSVSLELGTRPGCFVATAGSKVQVGCLSGGQAGFLKAASFARAEPLRRYHPISFAAKGARRGFVLEPLFTLRDEFYTVYFNLGA